jgi:hypothetical protein
MVKAGFALDMKSSGFGLVSLSYHAVAAHAPPLTDKLYLVLDSMQEPSDVYLPVPSSAPLANPSTIFQFDASNANKLVYCWKGKLNLLSRPASPQYCQVQADDYTNLVLRLRGDGGIIFEANVVSALEFTLPTLDEYVTYELELIGTSRVRRVQVAETIDEIM